MTGKQQSDNLNSFDNEHSEARPDHERIVITGMGLVSPLGLGVGSVWSRLINGESGIRPLPDELCENLPTKIAGQVPSIDVLDNGMDESHYLSPKERKRVDLFTLYALAAAKEALDQANWRPESDEEKESTATIIATGIGGFPTITKAHSTLLNSGPKRVSTFTVPAFLANLAAGNVSLKYGFKGPLGTPVTACAAGIQAIGDAMRLIRSGEANIALAGGAEACIDPLSLAGFGALKALSTRNETPEQASRPFDKDRDGFVMGEGAGLLVIESLSHALARGATPLAEIAGYGTSADAYHLTAGPESGEGAARAMKAAVKMAGIDVADIGYVNAHATSTPVGDKGEINALRALFGEHVHEVSISSTKSSIGHLLGAAGGVEAIFSAQALRTQTIPPTLNLEEPEASMADLDLVPLVAKEKALNYVLCNGFGFGGVNAAIILKRMS
ncbi:beta-ketoacyl-ACP synthase II [Marinomonas mediterranea]|jgi:3-oxoacyl-[acyl-carrier-protein] synthase II (EC 2.3.1.41)|uniref:3-oxoacyl-[acyl-carrier-protein] synthase 2 n=1 Tax=Marinomonas mediterranea (strain ATCC 700492 / JCM 21426 / NBRC 103028 / MMB-1) TaxID=717774 RepID=F2JUJ7_MARM1|nr:beta-ketoacyl-ACP synthase II [Marinomonas mediterranea]ADZ89330.1 3-oxoacyl-(acyl-carrier-protein) synthase 2 [Marinomonas mediterranea MMB-1]WCN07433.1 beta-ketoacyl-ACP synthase II [Marinomonas mediterranea]WCN15597.1 beta-ketoacyl-ACP synthase II [Marinomonas mediterranea MMB-1]